LEVPDNFFLLTHLEKIDFIEDHRTEVFENYPGEYLLEEILDYSRGKIFRYQEEGYSIQHRVKKITDTKVKCWFEISVHDVLLLFDNSEFKGEICLFHHSDESESFIETDEELQESISNFEKSDCSFVIHRDDVNSRRDLFTKA